VGMWVVSPDHDAGGRMAQLAGLGICSPLVHHEHRLNINILYIYIYGATILHLGVEKMEVVPDHFVRAKWVRWARLMRTSLHRMQPLLLLRCKDQLRDHEHNNYIVREIRSYVHLLMILRRDCYLMI
jgi:hypothetical protein